MSSTSTKTTIFTLAIVIYFVCSVSSYTYIRLAQERKGHCKDENGDVRKVGEIWQYEKRCEMATCSRQDGKLYEQVVGCIVMSARKGCKLVPKLGLTYPNCCPVLRCA